MVDSCEPGEYFFFVKLDYVFLFKMHNLELSTWTDSLIVFTPSFETCVAVVWHFGYGGTSAVMLLVIMIVLLLLFVLDLCVRRNNG